MFTTKKPLAIIFVLSSAAAPVSSFICAQRAASKASFRTSKWSTTQDNTAPPESTDEAKIRSEAEKIHASRIMHADKASKMKNSEIRREFLEWANNSGLIGVQGERSSAEVVMISRESTIPSCISNFWKGVAIITDKNSSPHTGEWLNPKIDDKRGKTFIMIMPECEELYKWDTMSLIDVTLDFCSSVCVKFGHNFSLTHFHPSYKNSPKMMDVGRHAPFPSFGINIGGPFDEDKDQFADVAVNQCKTDEEKLKIRHLKAKLTHIYNRPAAASPNDPMKLNHNERYRTRTFDDQRIISLSNEWIKEMLGTKKEKVLETAVKYILLDEDKTKKEINMRNCQYFITREFYAEHVYADAWAAVDVIYRSGLECEAEFEGKMNNDKFISGLFITPKFKSFNAEDFKKFAVTMNAALTRLSQGKMFCEVYHPEYVGKTRYDHELRRSPFPTLQICYEKGDDACQCLKIT